MQGISPFFNGLNFCLAVSLNKHHPCTKKEESLVTTGNPLITKRWQKIVKFNEFALNNVLIDLLTQTHTNVLKRIYG